MNCVCTTGNYFIWTEALRKAPWASPVSFTHVGEVSKIGSYLDISGLQGTDGGRRITTSKTNSWTALPRAVWQVQQGTPGWELWCNSHLMCLMALSLLPRATHIWFALLELRSHPVVSYWSCEDGCGEWLVSLVIPEPLFFHLFFGNSAHSHVAWGWLLPDHCDNPLFVKLHS